VGFSLGPTVTALHALPSPWSVVAENPSVPLVLATFAPVTIAGLRRLGLRSPAARVVLPWLVVPPVGVFVLSLLSNVSYNVRYSLAALPAFLMVVAAGCLSFRSRPLRQLTTAAVLACALASLAGFYWNETYDKEHVRDALAHVRASDRGATYLVVLGEVWRAFEYYARGSSVTLLPSCERPSMTDARSGAAAAEPPTLWVAAGRDWDGRAAACLQALSARYRQIERRRFVGIELWRLERDGA
jgi:hypothetical protein